MDARVIGSGSILFGSDVSQSQNLVGALLHALTGAHGAEVNHFLISDDFNCRGIKERVGQSLSFSEVAFFLEQHLDGNLPAQELARNFLTNIFHFSDTVLPWSPETGLSINERAMNLHGAWPGGKSIILPVKPLDLTLIYTPGVGAVCKAADNNPEDVYVETGRDRTGIICSDDTGVLGYGRMKHGSVLSVLQGKGLISQAVSGVGLIPLLLPRITDTASMELAYQIVASQVLQGGLVMVEDVGAPTCFDFVNLLRERLPIVAYQDDQEGTANVTIAALENALTIQGLDWKNARFVVNGLGAAGVAIVDMLREKGVELGEQLMALDSVGLVHQGRTDLNPHKRRLAVPATTDKKLAEVIRGAHVFIGVSVANVLTVDMMDSMQENGVVFAQANPDPEISIQLGLANKKKKIFGTGRSDSGIMINNASGYPQLNRGILASRATRLTRSMRHAVSDSLSAIGRQGITEEVRAFYDENTPTYGGWLVFPNVKDPRLADVSIAVAKAALADPTSGARNFSFDEREERERARANRHFMREYMMMLDRWTDGVHARR